MSLLLKRAGFLCIRVYVLKFERTIKKKRVLYEQ